MKHRWLKNLPKTASDLRNVLEPLENRVAEETSKYAADEVAQNIREYQLRPYRVDAVGRCAADPSARPRTRAQNQNPASDRESDDRIVDDFSLLGGGLPPEPQSTPRSSSPRRQSPCEDVIPEIRGIMRNQTEHYGNLRYKRPRLEGSNQETCDAPSLHGKPDLEVCLDFDLT